MDSDLRQEASSRHDGALWTSHVISECGIWGAHDSTAAQRRHTEASRSLDAPITHPWRRRPEDYDCSGLSACPGGNGTPTRLEYQEPVSWVDAAVEVHGMLACKSEAEL
ncbi:hypothetical protein PMIN03_002613 [Paraphaeosphaeria minitans]